MASPPKKIPDRHYNFRGMNIWFAWSSLALLVVTIWMVWADYAKPWKRMQAEFRELERQSVLGRAQQERQGLNENEIAQVRQEITNEEQELAAQRDEIGRLESERDAFGRRLYAADADSRSIKSLLDTARYAFDQAVQSGDETAIERRRSEVEELNSRLREKRKEVEELTAQRNHAEGQIAERRSGLTSAEGRLVALRKGLDTLEQQVERLDKKIDFFLLNAPLMDFLEPDLKVDQVMLSGLYNDINFTEVDRVDRCMTCHVAANRAGFDGEEWQAPFRSHPRLDLFLAPTSAHPYNRFGCTVCHGGLDRSTDFARVGHSPESEEQKQEWIEKYGWEEQPYLETPILPASMSEAGCVSCHADDVWMPGTENLQAGRELMRHMGCWACHKLEYPAFQELQRPGPSLERIAGKVSPGWAYQWVAAPRDFHPTTWMPHFFFQKNTTTAENLERQKAEIRATVAYIWDRSETPDYPPAPPGDAERGEELFETVGCTGCHVRQADAVRDDFFPQFNRLHGPNLIRLGNKVSGDWLFAWLKNPKQYNPGTRMPSLRLSDREAADLAAFLLSSTDPAYEDLEMPAVDPEIRDDLILGYLQNNQTIEQSHASLAAMSDVERDVYLGRETIQKYGCWGCHELAGFEHAKPIGVELTEEGSKPLHQFDFGHVHDVPHTRQDWIRTKLLDPRIWDEGKEAVKTYGELYRMPNFGMSVREAEAVVANVLGFTKETVRDTRKAAQTARAAHVADGRKLIIEYNCQGCHLVEGKGHAIAGAIDDAGLLPPNLAAQGARVQADWLFEFLHDPSQVTLRPWLGTRMPTFGFDDAQVNTLVTYFESAEARDSFLSPPDRPSERELAVGEIAFNMFQCAKCHPAGPSAAAAAGAGTADLAPSLLLADERLRHDWVPDWILDPQSWIPGTRMPANFQRAADGTYQSPLAGVIDAPMWSAQKRQLMRHFSSEEELREYVGDARKVAGAMRDHIWWSLER
jgi:cytochrome c2/predicted  nucleic acid-binding Zn-ribbon protein